MTDSEGTRSIGVRLRQARLANGLTQDSVVSSLGHGITKAALSKYELNQSIPGPVVLRELADALHTTTAYLLAQDTPEVQWEAQCFSIQRIGPRRRDQLTAMAASVLELHLELANLFSVERQRLVSMPTVVSTFADVEMAAQRMRHDLGVVDVAIESLTALLEDKGAVVLYAPLHSRQSVYGLPGHASDIDIALVRYSDDDEIRRSDLSQTLGLLAIDCKSIATDRDRTKMVRRFGMAFLAPGDIVRRELGDRRRQIMVEELAILQRRYGVAPDVWAERAFDLQIIHQAAYDRVRAELRCLPDAPIAPSGVYSEEPTRRRLLALRAFTEGLVSREWLRRVPWFERQGLLAEENEEPKTEAELLFRLPLESRHAVMRDRAKVAASLYRDRRRTAFARRDRGPVHRYRSKG